jgi:hypothetical protein
MRGPQVAMRGPQVAMRGPGSAMTNKAIRRPTHTLRSDVHKGQIWISKFGSSNFAGSALLWTQYCSNSRHRLPSISGPTVDTVLLEQ